MGYVKDVKIGDTTNLIEPVLYAVAGGTASAITAAITNFDLQNNVSVKVKMAQANEASATLNVNGTGAKPIWYDGAPIVPNAMKADRVYSLVYDGTYWQLTGDVDTVLGSRTYTDIIATGSNHQQTGFFYLKVTPDVFTDIWYTKCRVTATVPSNTSYKTVTEFEIWGTEATYVSYRNQNAIKATGYRPIYYNSVFFTNATGYNNGCSHWLGFNLYNATNPTNTSLKRTVTVELLDFKNCSVELQDTLITSTDIPNRSAHTNWYGSTYASYTNLDCYNNGTKFTGDNNTTQISNLTYGEDRYTAKNTIYRYQLLFTVDEDTLTPLNSNSNTTGATKTIFVDEKFDPLGDIFYWNSTTTINAGASVGGTGLSRGFSLVDFRYSLNLTNDGSLVAHKPTYMKVLPLENGMCKIASEMPLTQTLPTSEDGYLYILIGRQYDWYRSTLHPQRLVYYYKNGKILRYTGLKAQLDYILCNTARLDTLEAKTGANSTDYGPGSDGQVLRSNGTSVYWSDIPSGESGTSKGGAEVVIGTQTKASSRWTGTVSFSELKPGQEIIYWLPFAYSTGDYVAYQPTGGSNANGVGLNLTLSDGTDTGFIPCFYGGVTRIASQYGAGNVVRLLYLENVAIGTQTVTAGWWADANYDTNTYNRVQYAASVTAASAINAGRLGVFNSAGKLVLLSTTAFDITKPILYIGTNFTSSALTQSNNYIAWGAAFSLANTVSGFSGTAGAAVYIKGTLSGNMFTPASGVLTTTVPTTEDGYDYMLLGLMSTTVNAVLPSEHPIFRYFNGAFRHAITPASIGALATTGGNVTGNIKIVKSGGGIYIQNPDDDNYSVAYQGPVINGNNRALVQVRAPGSTGLELYYFPAPDVRESSMGYSVVTTKPEAAADSRYGLQVPYEIHLVSTSTWQTIYDAFSEIRSWHTAIFSCPSNIARMLSDNKTPENQPLSGTIFYIEANDGYYISGKTGVGSRIYHWKITNFTGAAKPTISDMYMFTGTAVT